ncbi:hypothetical protein BKA56DRAFT_658794 [Ilyonectria sp. MPI-CAGE-AT-0026]|nr:hypothetical protein BKA56DRAFT_658794 [Ilyonectria sp. MPI-CAGE-AT-0026]
MTTPRPISDNKPPHGQGDQGGECVFRYIALNIPPHRYDAMPIYYCGTCGPCVRRLIAMRPIRRAVARRQIQDQYMQRNAALAAQRQSAPQDASQQTASQPAMTRVRVRVQTSMLLPGTRGQQQQMNRRMLAYSNGDVAGVSRSAGDARASAPAAVPTPASLPTQVDAVTQSARGMVTVTVRSIEAQVTFWPDVRGQRAQQDGAHGQQF